ncbi:MAG: transcriptional regulator NrdR [Candidatus Altiarchaeota archaeon]|nr:transcriptional regulator NrdR [Candidatus Altiarchaeota archaeon]
MKCLYCSFSETRVIDSRESGPYAIRRRRECMDCKKRFTTYERVELTPLYVIKRDGGREEFNRKKLKKGIMKALEKRPIGIDAVEDMIDEVEEKVHQLGKKEVESSKIGEITLRKLKKLDQVAYIRFASVYRSFTDITSFEEELKNLVKGE